MKPQHLAVIGGKLDNEDPAGALAIELANELAGRGHRVTMLSHKVVMHAFDERVTLLTPGSPPRDWVGLIRYRRWVSKMLAEVQPDHTVSLLTTVPAETIAPMGGLLSSRMKAARIEPLGFLAPIARHFSCLWPNIAIPRQLEKQALSSEVLKSVIGLSAPIEADLQASSLREGVSVVRAHVPIVHPLIDVSQGSLLRAQLARAWGVAPDAYWITLPFRNAGRGGLEPMVRAFKPLIEQGVDAVLLLAGPSRYTHLAWIGQLGLRERVRFVGKTTRLEELLAASDLIASPTNDDPLGWTIRPAIPVGKPIVTTTACGLAEIVRHQGGTVLPAPAEPQALVEAIREHHTHWQSGETVRQSLKTPVEPSLIDAVEALLNDDLSPSPVHENSAAGRLASDGDLT